MKQLQFPIFPEFSASWVTLYLYKYKKFEFTRTNRNITASSVLSQSPVVVKNIIFARNYSRNLSLYRKSDLLKIFLSQNIVWDFLCESLFWFRKLFLDVLTRLRKVTLYSNFETVFISGDIQRKVFPHIWVLFWLKFR